MMSTTPSTWIAAGCAWQSAVLHDGFVVDRRHHAEHALPVVAPEDARARWHRHVHQRPARGVAEDARLRVRIHHLVAIGSGRERDAARFVEHAHLVDGLLARHVVHHLVGVLAPVLEHRVPGRGDHGLRHQFRAERHFVQELPLLRLDVGIGEDALDDDDDRGEVEHELAGNATGHGNLRPCGR
ncbi:MAG: hypothetical protein IPP62_08005 [bacterium]|nr:hypothetical protein [bacterium]